jgi:hypothetical protein
LFEKQAQSTTGESTALQAGRDIVIVQGVTATEVRQIALDVMRSNLLEYAGQARTTALERGNEISDKFVSKLQSEHPQGLEQARAPGFQDALFTVQKEYAKAGDKDLGDLLVDLLVDRTKQSERDILQLVLSESLVTAPKLTNPQINLLSIIFMLRYVSMSVPTLPDLAKRLEVPPLTGGFANSSSALQHLEFAGCGTSSIGSIALEGILSQTYPGLFKIGFASEAVEDANLSSTVKANWIMPCLNDPAKLQVAALNQQIFEAKLKVSPVPDDEQIRLRQLYDQGTMDGPVMIGKLLEAAPFLKPIVESWSKCHFESFNLTSVGIAIGHANIKRYTGEFAPLSIWIN